MAIKKTVVSKKSKPKTTVLKAPKKTKKKPEKKIVKKTAEKAEAKKTTKRIKANVYFNPAKTQGFRRYFKKK